MDRIIVSGADARYFPLLAELHRSLAERGVLDRAALGVVDCGLSADQRMALESAGAEVAKADWGFDFPLRETVEATVPGLKAMTARPMLPQLFPGRRLVMWLDADTWVQDAGIVELFFATADRGALAATLELDRAYAHLRVGRRYWDHLARWWEEASASTETAEAMAWRPIINSGAFAMPADAPVWRSWLRTTRAWYGRQTEMRRSTPLVEQFALNFVAYRGGYPLVPLPTRCNWLCHLAMPAWDPATGRLCDPLPPHEPLGLVHVCDWTKNYPHDIAGLDGTTRRMRITYPPTPEAPWAAKNADGESAG
ncbi:MAG: hypothetical protein AB7P02_02595 [Alphaproteobacteria bacterium]